MRRRGAGSAGSLFAVRSNSVQWLVLCRMDYAAGNQILRQTAVSEAGRKFVQPVNR